MKVIAICATSGRHTCLERSVRLFLEQDYEGEHKLLIFNNSGSIQTLNVGELPSNKEVLLINQHICSSTGLLYSSLGEIYNDILENYIKDEDFVLHWDDDDLFLSFHIKVLVEGMNKNPEMLAYKAKHSIFRSAQGCHLEENNMEPSIIIKTSHLKEYKYSNTTTEQHLNWLNPLIYQGKLKIDENCPSSLIYNWGDTFPTFKTSGNPSNPNNFNNYKKASKEEGDYLITPADKEQINQILYKCIQNLGN